MRKIFTVAAVMLAIFVLASPSVMAKNYNFYQWLRDDDGDGIPNCIDPDYVRPEDGTGYGKIGPSLAGVPCGDQDQLRDRDQIRDRDQLKDGSCETAFSGYVYKLSYKHSWAGTRK